MNLPGILMSGRARLAGLGIVVVGLGGLITRDVFFSSAASTNQVRTVTATLATVAATVSGTGTLEPVGQVNLNFRTAGQLTEVDVKPGDHVQRGQVLARIDPSSQQAALAQAQASLQSAEAGLTAARNPLSAAQLQQLRDQVNASQIAYNDSMAATQATNQSDLVTIQVDLTAVANDARCASQPQPTPHPTPSPSPAASPSPSGCAPDSQLAQLADSLSAAQLSYADSVASVNATNLADATTITNDTTQLARDQACSTPGTAGCVDTQLQQLIDSLNSAQTSYNDTAAAVNLTNAQDQAAVNADCPGSQCTSDQNRQQQDLQSGSQKLHQAQAQLTSATDTYNAHLTSTAQTNSNLVNTDTLKLQSDQAHQQQDLIAGQSKLDGAQGQLTSAEDALQAHLASQQYTQQTQLTTDQNKLATDQARVASDQVAGVQRADQSQASLTAAQDNLAVQSEVKPNAVASALAQVATSQAQVQANQLSLDQTTLTAPYDGVIESVAAEVGETAGGSTGSTVLAPGSAAPLPTTSTAAAGLFTLGDISGLAAVVPFAETDAARLAPQQTVIMTFDAVNGLSTSGQVIAVSSTSTVTSNVVNYYATIALNHTDPRLKTGMTSNAVVTVAQVDNAVAVPNAAITRSGGTATVVVQQGKDQVTTEVEPGLVGDSLTEVRAGLSAGDVVVLPSLHASSSSAAGRGGGGGLGGLGGGGGAVFVGRGGG
ncbi:MAG: efflux RND transporter periplasmic adaptor subunit [Candidatus Dormibacteria bacterium]